MFNLRVLDSEYARYAAWRRFAEDGHFLAQPDNHWDIVIFRRNDRVAVLRTGLTTQPHKVDYSAGDEILVISFHPHCVMPAMPGDAMLNTGTFLDLVGQGTVNIASTSVEIPTLDNADAFVNRLAATGVVEVSRVVRSILDGNGHDVPERTRQRHFLKVTGLTYKRFTMITRAQEAASLLRAGRPAADVASALGFADQAHMINSLRRILGQTPGEIVRDDAP